MTMTRKWKRRAKLANLYNRVENEAFFLETSQYGAYCSHLRSLRVVKSLVKENFSPFSLLRVPPEPPHAAKLQSP